MKSFLEVQQIHTDKILESKKIAADAQRVKLLSAIKTTYGITNFKSLSESEKLVYKNMINEMWDSIDGLNERGLKFVNESEISLSKESSTQEIIKFIEQEFKNNLMGYFEGITGKRFTGGSNPITPKRVRNEVEKLTGKRFKPADFKKIFKSVLASMIDSSDMF